MRRVTSPSGGSISMTRAPMSPRYCAVIGPSTTDDRSRIPVGGPSVVVKISPGQPLAARLRLSGIMAREMICFMTSTLPPPIRPTRASTKARAIGYSHM
jgi:hypothetical protein